MTTSKRFLCADVWRDIVSFLHGPDQFHFSLANSSLYKASWEVLNGSALLRHVIRGNQTNVEKILTRYPQLLLYTGPVVDCSKRVFQNVTALQLALWAMDSAMWDVILRCVPNDSTGTELWANLSKQRNKIATTGVTYYLDGNRITESHYVPNYDLCMMPFDNQLERNKLYIDLDGDLLRYAVIAPSGQHKMDTIAMSELDYDARSSFTLDDFKSILFRILQITSERGHTHKVLPLLNAFNFYINRYGIMDGDKRDAYLCKIIGTAQRYLPIHAVKKHYFHQHENSNEPLNFRNAGTNACVEWFSANNQLGVTLAVLGTGEESLPIGRSNAGIRGYPGWSGGVNDDFDGLVTLFDEASNQLKELDRGLSNLPYYPAKKSDSMSQKHCLVGS